VVAALFLADAQREGGDGGGCLDHWGTTTRPSSPGGRPPRGKRLPLEKLADLAPCQDQIDKVIENQGEQRYCKIKGKLLAVS